MSENLCRARLLRAALGLLGPVEPDASTWRAWSSVARTERVVPLLFVAATAHPSTLSDAQRRRALEMQLDVASLCVRNEGTLLQVASALEGEGVPFAVLKGCATAHLDYDEPSLRQFGDVDLLVDSEDLARTRHALEERGWRQAYSLPPHHDRFTHAVTFTSRNTITELDVHQHIAHRALGLRVPTSELLAARVPFEVARRQLWALSGRDRLIHACVHATSSRGPYRRLSSVADVLVLSRDLAAGAREILDQAEDWRIRPLVEAAIEDAHVEAMLPLPEAWSAAMQAPILRRDRLVERAYLTRRRRAAVEELAHLRMMPSWRDRFLYLYGHLQMDSGPGSGGLRKRLRYLRSRLRQRS